VAIDLIRVQRIAVASFVLSVAAKRATDMDRGLVRDEQRERERERRRKEIF